MGHWPDDALSYAARRLDTMTHNICYVGGGGDTAGEAGCGALARAFCVYGITIGVFFAKCFASFRQVFVLAILPCPLLFDFA